MAPIQAGAPESEGWCVGRWAVRGGYAPLLRGSGLGFRV